MDYRVIIKDKPPDLEQFGILNIYVEKPNSNPKYKSIARPNNGLNTLYSTICLRCGIGIHFETSEIINEYGYKFIKCSKCDIDPPEQVLPKFIDPFINPVNIIYNETVDKQLDDIRPDNEPIDIPGLDFNFDCDIRPEIAGL